MNIENALQKVLGFGAKEFIEEALAGEWNPHGRYGGKITGIKKIKILPPGLQIVSFIAREAGDQPPLEALSWERSYAEILLDPLSWAAVGKVEGWKEHRQPCSCEKCVFKKEDLSWDIAMHRFLDALIEQTYGK